MGDYILNFLDDHRGGGGERREREQKTKINTQAAAAGIERGSVCVCARLHVFAECLFVSWLAFGAWRMVCYCATILAAAAQHKPGVLWRILASSSSSKLQSDNFWPALILTVVDCLISRSVGPLLVSGHKPATAPSYTQRLFHSGDSQLSSVVDWIVSLLHHLIASSDKFINQTIAKETKTQVRNQKLSEKSGETTLATAVLM